MKKLFAVFFAAAACCAFGGAAEEAVKQVYVDYHKAIIDMDFSKVMPMLSPDYEEISAEGRRVSRQEAVKVGKVMEVMNTAVRPEATLLEIADAMASAGGPAVTPEMREQLKQLGATDEGKKQAERTKLLLKAMLGQLKGKMNEAWASQKIISCEVEGNAAKLVFEMKSLESDKLETSTWDLVRSNGKWLIKKSVSKYKK